MHTIDCTDPNCLFCGQISAGKSSDEKNQVKMTEEMFVWPELPLPIRARLIENKNRVKNEIHQKICELIKALRDREKILLNELGYQYFAEIDRINCHFDVLCSEASSTVADSKKMELFKTKQLVFNYPEMKHVIKQLEVFGQLSFKDFGEEEENVSVEDQKSGVGIKMVLDHKPPSKDDSETSFNHKANLLKGIGRWSYEDIRESIKKAQNQTNGAVGQIWLEEKLPGNSSCDEPFKMDFRASFGHDADQFEDYHSLMDKRNKLLRKRMLEEKRTDYVSGDDPEALSGSESEEIVRRFYELQAKLCEPDINFPADTSCVDPLQEDSMALFGLGVGDGSFNDNSEAFFDHVKDTKKQESLRCPWERRTELLKKLVSDTKPPGDRSCVGQFKEDSKSSFGQGVIDGSFNDDSEALSGHFEDAKKQESLRCHWERRTGLLKKLVSDTKPPGEGASRNSCVGQFKEDTKSSFSQGVIDGSLNDDSEALSGHFKDAKKQEFLGCYWDRRTELLKKLVSDTKPPGNTACVDPFKKNPKASFGHGVDDGPFNVDSEALSSHFKDAELFKADINPPAESSCVGPFEEDSEVLFGQGVDKEPNEESEAALIAEFLKELVEQDKAQAQGRPTLTHDVLFEKLEKQHLKIRQLRQLKDQNSNGGSNAFVSDLKQLPTEIDGNGSLNQMNAEGSLNIPGSVFKPIKKPSDPEPAVNPWLETNLKCANKFPIPDCTQMTPHKPDENDKAAIALQQSTFLCEEFSKLRTDLKEIKKLLQMNKEYEKDISSDEDDMEIISKSEAASIPSELPQPPSGLTKKASLLSRRRGIFASNLAMAVKKGMSKMGDKKSLSSVATKDASSGVGESESSGERKYSVMLESAENSPGCSFDKGSASSSSKEAGKKSCYVVSDKAGNDPSAALLSTFSKYLSKHAEDEWLASVKISDQLVSAESSCETLGQGLFSEDAEKAAAYWLDKTYRP